MTPTHSHIRKELRTLIYAPNHAYEKQRGSIPLFLKMKLKKKSLREINILGRIEQIPLRISR